MHENTELEYAGFWIRTWATIIDTLLLMIIVLPLTFSIYGMEYLDSDKLIVGPADFLINYVLPFIGVIAFWVYRSATPGKILTGQKIVDAQTGEQPSSGQFIGRYFAYIISMIPLLLGFFWVAFDERKQGFHDKLAGTVVVRKKKAGVQPVGFKG